VDSVGPGFFPLHLRAEQPAFSIDLHLEEGKPPTLQGDRGLSLKGAQPGQASYYYSVTRMPSSGTVRVADRSFPVEGLSWLDREWGTSALGDDQVGWDWFALQLFDGRDLMYYQLRQRDGQPDPFSAGTLVQPNGATTRLSGKDFSVSVTSYWRSPIDGTLYPSAWQLDAAKESIHWAVKPAIADQELNLAIRYWEGAVEVSDLGSGAAIGNGYAELTGYAGNGAG